MGAWVGVGVVCGYGCVEIVLHVLLLLFLLLLLHWLIDERTHAVPPFISFFSLQNHPKTLPTSPPPHLSPHTTPRPPQVQQQSLCCFLLGWSMRNLS